MRLFLLAFFALFLGLSLNAETMQEDITWHYYQAKMTNNRLLAEKLLECCDAAGKQCDRPQVIQNSQNQIVMKKYADKIAFTKKMSLVNERIDQAVAWGQEHYLLLRFAFAGLCICGLWFKIMIDSPEIKYDIPSS